MKHVQLCRLAWAVVAICFAYRFAHAAPDESTLPKPIWFGQRAFSIPFNVQAALPADQQPAQVQLYVTTDRGGTWRLAQTLAPTAKNFDFRAPADGEYGFLIRTVDRAGRVSPDASGPPELRVVVDTAPPALELTAMRGPSGEVRGNWKAADPLLNAESLKIEYQVSAGTWRQVAIDRAQVTADDSNSSGSVTWWPNDALPPPAAIAVRAEIRDRAGNPTRVQAKTQTAAADPMPSQQPSSDRTTNNTRSPWPDSATPWPSTRASESPVDRGVANQNTSQSFAGGSNNAPPSYFTQNSDWPRANFDRGNPSRSPSDVPDYSQAMVSPINPAVRSQMPIVDEARDSRRSNGNRRNSDGDRSTAERSAAERNAAERNENDRGRNDRAAENRLGADRRTSGDSPPALARPGENWNLPAGQQPRLVNSRSFEMDYEIESIGPSGIAKVELWGTRDGGRSWSSFGVDNDNRSPIRVNVDGEGLYGFRIAVQSGSGVGSPLPRSGDQPEILIAVDLTKPNARLTDVQTGMAQHAGEMLIRWEATDAALAVRPVTLLFADKIGGPWTTIAANLENSGSYVWRPDERVPDRVYLRIEARDEAGNIGSYETADSIPLDRIRPEGRIRGVRPINNSASRVQVYQFTR